MKRLLLLLLAAAIILLSALPPAAAIPAIPKVSVTVPTTTIPPNVVPNLPVSATTTKEKCWDEGPRDTYISIISQPPGANISFVFHRDPQTSAIFDLKTQTPLGSPFYASCQGMTYSFILVKDGYQVYTSEPFSLDHGQTHQINAILVPLTTTTAQGQGSSQPAATGAVAALPHDFGSQASAPGTAASGAGAAATAAAAGQSSQGSAPGTGSLSVITNPAGASVSVDGVPAGGSPATIPGLAAGAHSLKISMPGYAELTTQVNIVAGQANEYSTSLLPSTEPTKKQSPGFELILAGLAVSGMVLLRRTR